MAPFAFLGPQYDEALQGFYTTTTTADVFTERSRMMALMRGDALARTAPLAALLEQYVDAPLLEEVARAHRQGRRLYMGTVDLDTRSFTVWGFSRDTRKKGIRILVWEDRTSPSCLTALVR